MKPDIPNLLFFSTAWRRGSVTSAVQPAAGGIMFRERKRGGRSGNLSVCLLALFIAAFAAVTATAQSNYEPYLFTTFAGDAGYGSADGSGSAAGFWRPEGVAVDSMGNVYVADTYNHTIRKITPVGDASTFAGSAGSYGTADGTGNNARFSYPRDVAIDNTDNIYVADSANYTIRKITPAGVVTTLAGLAGFQGSADGTGSAARFHSPFSVAVDGAGNVYVADTYGETIRKVTPAGVVSTLAGLAGNPGSDDGTGSAARFGNPEGVATDTGGTVYVADTGNNTIRKITPTGEVSTFAGAPGFGGYTDGTGSIASFSYPARLAVDSVGNIYVGDANNNAIRKITPAREVSTLAGGSRGSNDGTGSTAQFWNPYGVAPDSAGNVYVADNGNHTIRKITPAADVTTLAGFAAGPGSADGTGGAARFNYPTGVALDGAGNIYVADSQNYTIRKITPARVVSTLAGLAGNGGRADGMGSDARFFFPRGVAVDSAANVYVADMYNETIRKITPAGNVSTLAGLANAAGSTDGAGSEARFSEPSAVALDSLGNVYVADTNNHTIRKITAAGVVSTVAGLAGSCGSDDGMESTARFCTPQGVAVDSADNVYVADTGNRAIRKITPGGLVSTVADNTAGFVLVTPFGIAVDSSGYIYVGDSFSDTVLKVTPAGEVRTLGGSFFNDGDNDGSGDHARFSSPYGVAVDSAGNVYVADGNNHTIRVGIPDPTNLSNLALSAGNLDPAFSSNTTSYTASVPYSTSSITVTPTVADSTATVTVNGQTVPSGSASSPIGLSVGNNTINTVVIAQDGTTTKTYTVVVNRAAASNQSPIADAGGPYTGLARQNIQFDGSGSSDPDGQIVFYAWAFGDGGTGQGIQPIHPYESPGTYVATLTVTDAFGATGTDTATVTVANQRPIADAGGPYTGTAGQAIQFDGSGSSDPDGHIVDFAWAFGDGGTATGIQPTHSYDSPGTYVATLTATDAFGAIGTDTATVTVEPTPTPTPTPTATPTPTPTVQVTVQTNPAGRSFTVDGTSYSSTQTFSWVPGSSHTIATTSPQSGGTGTQYVWTKWSDGGTISHTVAPTTNKTYTATFRTQYFLTMTHGTGGTVKPGSGWKNSGAAVSISATVASGYSFSNWTGTGTGSYSGTNNPASITMNGPITENASFTQNNAQVTVQTNPAGVTFSVDGTTYTTTQTFSWQPGSSHTIATTSPQDGNTGVRYIWNNWGGGGAISHTVAPTTNKTYTATFKTQYYLTMTHGTGGTVKPTSGWKSAGAAVSISGTPTSGYSFAGWSGTGTGSYSGTNNPASITMNGPITENASFTQNNVQVTVQTNPAGLSFSADDTPYTSAQTFSWDPGSSHTIATTSPQDGGSGVRYVWKNWSGGGAISHTVAPTTNKTYTANFNTQYFLTMSHGIGGSVKPTSGWKASGSTVSISAVPANGYSFTNWTGSGTGSYSGSNNPASITMGGPITETGAFTHN